MAECYCNYKVITFWNKAEWPTLPITFPLFYQFHNYFNASSIVICTAARALFRLKALGWMPSATSTWVTQARICLPPLTLNCILDI